MRVIFLSSAYFGYVHTWAFEPDTSFAEDSGEAVLEPSQKQLPAASAARRRWPERGALLFRKLIATRDRQAEQAR